ncbi:MAG: TlpA family protein disulfide reductase [Puniceicoccaceae bacterium]
MESLQKLINKGKLLLLPSLLLTASSLDAQRYQVGDIVQDVTFRDYKTGMTTSLYELGSEGGVLVLEWFAWWCPFCTHAAANVEDGIVNYYASNGHPNQVPVRHIGLNVQGNSRAQSDTFISTYGVQTVVEDYDRSFFYEFSDAGQPLFVVINAEPNSPSAQQWEVLSVWLTYGSFPDVSTFLRPIINSVEAGIPPDPALMAFSSAPDPVDGWYASDWFGNFHGGAFPWILHEELGYGFVLDGPGDSIYLWRAGMGWHYTDPMVYPFLYSSAIDQWIYPLLYEEELWYYDYNAQSWLRFP